MNSTVIDAFEIKQIQIYTFHTQPQKHFCRFEDENGKTCGFPFFNSDRRVLSDQWKKLYVVVIIMYVLFVSCMCYFYLIFWAVLHTTEMNWENSMIKAQKRGNFRWITKSKMFQSHFSIIYSSAGFFLPAMVIKPIIDNRQTNHFWSLSFVFFIKSIWPPGPYLPSKRKMTEQICCMMDDGAFMWPM